MLDKTTDPKSGAQLREEQAEALMQEGNSAAETAKILGISRSAVLGLIHRAKARRGGEVASRPARPLRRIKNLFIPAKPARVPAPKASPTPPQVANDGAGVEIWDLKGGQCRWPLWGDHEPATGFFCRAESETGHSWCPAHKRIVYAGSASALAAA